MIFIKYELSDAKTQKAVEEYQIPSIPTFLFLDSNGAILSRIVGSMSTVKEFIDDLAEAMKPENSFVAREKKYKEDPQTAFEYISFLKNNSYPSADSVLIHYFDNASMEEKFSKEWISFYKRYIYFTSHPVFKSMLENQKAVTKIMGKEEYGTFVKDVYINEIQTSFVREKNEDLDDLLKMMKSYPVLKNGFAEFVEANKMILVQKNFSSILKAVELGIENCGSKTRENLIQLFGIVCESNENHYKNMIGVYEKAALCEKDSRKSQEYVIRARMVKKYLEQEKKND